ncbi:MAG TPA: hypothetical protein PKX07_22840, partial [Aggregatilineales bacterium]|nr:hypothetical protein [Aggregatilineales bacterium]
YSGTHAGRVIVGPETSALDRPDSRPVMAFSRVLDFAGRPTRIASGGGEYQLVAYCPLLNGGQQTLVSAVNAPNGFGCASPDFAQRLTHDAHGRLAQVEDGLGTRTYTYSTDADAQEYRVSVDFGGGFTWSLAYNAAGDLIRWTDDAGVTRVYAHDTAGRMLSVTVDGEPEASYTFEYNALGQVTRQVDGLGRGTVYQFDARGLLTLQQDALTSDAFTFAYSSFGDLTTIISPLGNTITLLYQDAGDPRRLTGIIDSSGVEERFIWDDDNNVLIYRDSRGLETRYWFDAFNQLWRIDDAAGTTHTLRYDGAGNLQRWATGTARAFSFAPNVDGTLTLSEASQPNWRWDVA